MKNFVDGQPSPNPSFPQGIEVVTGDNVVKHVGKNIAKSYVNSNARYRYSNSLYVDAEFEVGTKYVISFVDESVGNAYYRNEYFMSNVSSYSITASGQRQYYYFECKSNDKTQSRIYEEGKGYVIFKNMNELSILPQFKDIQVEEVESYDVLPTSYEPYKEKNYQLDLEGKNLYNIEKITVRSFINQAGNIIVFDNWVITDFIRVQPNQQYTYQGITNPGNAPYSAFYDKDKKLISTFKTQIGNTTITIPANAYYVRFSILSKQGESNVETFQFEKGAVATDYEDYWSIELCKIGDYSDILFKNVVGDENYNAELESGAWYKKECIGEINRSSNITWGSAKDNNSDKMRYNIINNNVLDIMPLTQVYSTHFNQKGNNRYFEANAINNPQSGNITMSLGDATTLNDFVNWFNTNNVEIKYIKNNPTYTKITNPTLISQLESLRKAKWFKGVNHWWTETENLEPVLKGTYRQAINE